METYQVPTIWQSIQYFGLTVSAFAVAMPFIASYVWYPYWKRCQDEPPETYITPFEFRYPIEDAHDDGDIPDNSYVMEATPQGMVLMKYNPETDVFEYWGGRNIEYKYLETLSRKFVTVFHCSRVYHDWNPYATQTTDEDQEHVEQEKEQATDNEKETSNNSVFATFKTYNNSTLSKQSTAQQGKVRNHYTHKGQLNEFFSEMSGEQGNTQHGNEIDFATYKKMCFGS